MKTFQLFKIIKAAFIILIISYFFSPVADAQSPEKISYQAVIRNGSGDILTNTQIGMQISILQGTADGNSVYEETQNPETNTNGLITLEIGDGNITSGNLSNINWSDGPYFIKTEIDPSGGTNYTISGTSQILSVPYAIHAKTAESITGNITETDPVYTSSQASYITATDITNLNNLSGLNTGDQDISGITTNTQAIQDTASQIRADIPDVSGFISTETDPVYGASIASRITANDTIKWNNKLDIEVDGSITNEIQNLDNVLTQNNSAGNKKIVNLANPTDAQDAVTKAYTDSMVSGINYADIKNSPVTANIDSSYIVSLDKNDEDYVNLGTFENFTNNASWAVIERVKMPAGTGADGGWHVFRGKAWEDKEGDIAIQIKNSQVYAWVQKGGWQHVAYNAAFNEEQWYNICLQYNALTSTLELYVDGQAVGQQTGISPQDDSGNTNNLFWGGQDVAPSRNQGDLYAEASIVIANQVWLHRILTSEEIQNYDGHIDADPAIFFSSSINSNAVTDGSGNSHDGTNGNTPEYMVQTQQSSEFNYPVIINDKVALSGNMQITGDISDHSSSGMTVVAPVGANDTGFGAALYVSSDGTLKEADADALTTMPCVALALESGTGNKEVLLQGFIKNESWTWTPGGFIYVSPTTGIITQTKPSTSGQQFQILGVAVSDNMIYFTPNLMLIEIK